MDLIKKLMDDILAQPGFSPTQIAIGTVMYGGWLAAYVFIIIQGFKDKSYGVPLVTLCLNITWEFMMSFNLLDSRVHWFFLWGNRLWLVFDVFIITQLLLYGRAAQTNPLVKRFFFPIVLLLLVASTIGIYTFTHYFADYKGMASSFMINVLLSALYLRLFFARPDLRGLSYPAAWGKMIGSAAGAIFCYVWWPAQFKNGVLITHSNVHEPNSFAFLNFCYVTIFVLDCVYVYLLTQHRKELRLTALSSAAGGITPRA